MYPVSNIEQIKPLWWIYREKQIKDVLKHYKNIMACLEELQETSTAQGQAAALLKLFEDGSTLLGLPIVNDNRSEDKFHELFKQVMDRIEDLQPVKLSREEIHQEDTEILLRLMLVLPSSLHETERSFSTLRRLKTYLRNTMTQKRLNHVAVCQTHKTEVDKLETRYVVNIFISTNKRRKQIFGKDKYPYRGPVVMYDSLDVDSASDSEDSDELVNPDDTDTSPSTSEYEMLSPVKAQAATLTDDIINKYRKMNDHVETLITKGSNKHIILSTAKKFRCTFGFVYKAVD
ncbi:hypothetical protein ANN_06736 [Periplaneta americana]|uniref:HAT C-terminal dimerisation domain-containing protein n=1 Tax=Periplaneta americana TaxID=6978 RepID=A0ABQ8TG83_PERAM|nr:hypothetical protein ANN_06736 [Periplaneta americana]